MKRERQRLPLVPARPPRDIPAISEEDLMRGYGLIEPMSLLAELVGLEGA